MSKREDNTVSAEKQVDENIFYVGDKNAKLKISVLGNSITLHGVAPQIGWNNQWGMAASKKENDFVHRLFAYLKNDGSDACIQICQIADWERNFATDDLKRFDSVNAFAPDVVIFRAGENTPQTTVDEFYSALEKLVEKLDCEKLVFTTTFWDIAVIDEAINRICNENGYPVASLLGLCKEKGMTAAGLFEHSGVAAHPGDLGMKAIAERIYEKLMPMVKGE